MTETPRHVANLDVVEQDGKQIIKVDLDDSGIYQRAKDMAAELGDADRVDEMNREIATKAVYEVSKAHGGFDPSRDTTIVVNTEIPVEL